MSDILEFHLQNSPKKHEEHIFLSIMSSFDVKTELEDKLIKIKECKKELNIEKMKIPLIHVCNSCNFGWPIYFEVKNNLPKKYEFATKKQLFDLTGFINGLILLEAKDEIQFIKNHIESVRKILNNSIDQLSNLEKRLQIGDIEGSIDLLFEFTKSDSFFHQTAIIIKSRYFTLNRSNQMGVISDKEYFNEMEAIGRSILDLMNTFKQYQRFE